jgi:hypothetical protein
MPKKLVSITARIAFEIECDSDTLGFADESNEDRDESWLEDFLNMVPPADSPIRLDTDFDLLEAEIEINNVPGIIREEG